MSTTTPQATEQKTPEQLQAEAEAAERAAQQRAEHVDRVQADFEPLMGERVRVHFDNRKMSVPGRLFTSDEIPVGLATNWGLELDLTKEPYTRVEIKDLDSGRFTEYVPPTPEASDDDDETPEELEAEELETAEA